MKIIVTKILTNLVENSLLSLLYPALETKNRNQVLTKLVVWYKEYLFSFQVFLFFFKSYIQNVIPIQAIKITQYTKTQQFTSLQVSI